MAVHFQSRHFSSFLIGLVSVAKGILAYSTSVAKDFCLRSQLAFRFTNLCLPYDIAISYTYNNRICHCKSEVACSYILQTIYEMQIEKMSKEYKSLL